MNPETGSPERKESPFIHRFYASPLSGEEIEARSMETIDKGAPIHPFNPDEWQVVRRMIHTTGDFSLIDAVRFSPDAIAMGIEALRSGKVIYVDSRMIQAGLSLSRLRSVTPSYDRDTIVCHVGDEDVAKQATQSSLPRAIFSLRKAKPILNGSLAVFGNSPIALLELNRLILEEGIRPALVIAMPVGFVHVIESKEELMSLGVPYIAVNGRRGGSPLAVSVIHALCSIAINQRENPFAEPAPLAKDSENPRDEAIILLGHGSRVPGAGRDMERVANYLKEKYGHPIVEICHLSRWGPHFPEVLEKCVHQGARKIIVVPYFLHAGLHILLDIPEILQEEAQKFPEVKVILGKSLGFNEALVDLIQRGIEEAREFCDVRHLVLPSRERFPVPPGQFEFIPMPPDEAKKYRGKG
jgi:precorrin-8X/cobalt-precorrin-8 methylmutase